MKVLRDNRDLAQLKILNLMIDGRLCKYCVANGHVSAYGEDVVARPVTDLSGCFILET